MNQKIETMTLLGVKPDGSTVNLGKVPISLSMKRKEIAQEFFGSLSLDSYGNDADLCLWALETYHTWLESNILLKDNRGIV